MPSCVHFGTKSQVRQLSTYGCKIFYCITNCFSRDELLEWFISLQLSEYTHLFDSTEDVAWLDKLPKRYTWFKRQLLQCEEKFRGMFPVHWELSERIAVEFCKVTKYVILAIIFKKKLRTR